MNPHTLIRRASELGLTLQPRGDKLAVIPARLCPADFANDLRQHKGELLSMLEARAANLTADCAPWLHVARQVLAGEFEGADGSTVASLCTGLRAVAHPCCQRALEVLEGARNRQGWP